MGRGSDTVSGAVGGAATGAAIGSVFPVYGTAIGAGIGAIAGGAAGYFGSSGDKKGSASAGHYLQYQPQWDQYSGLANQYGGRMAPQAAQSGYTGQQQMLGGMLAREAGGNGIGQRLIRQQAQGQADRGMQQQMAQAASARPGMGGLATRQAMMNSANMNSMVGGQAAGAQGQYQLGAMGQYGQFLQGARGQDNDMNQFNANMRLQQLGLNDRSQLEALGQRLQMNNAAQQNRQFNAGLEQQMNINDNNTPSLGDKLLGAGTGAGTAWLMNRKS